MLFFGSKRIDLLLKVLVRKIFVMGIICIKLDKFAKPDMYFKFIIYTLTQSFNVFELTEF